MRQCGCLARACPQAGTNRLAAVHSLSVLVGLTGKHRYIYIHTQIFAYELLTTVSIQ